MPNMETSFADVVTENQLAGHDVADPKPLTRADYDIEQAISPFGGEFAEWAASHEAMGCRVVR